MRKFILLPMLLCILAAAAPAAPILIGPRVGLSVPKLHGGNDPMSTGYTTRLAASFGVFADIGVAPGFSVQPEINYVPQGGKREGMQPLTTVLPDLPLPPGTMLYADFKNVVKLTYIEVPVLAKFRFGSNDRFYLDLGPYVGYLVAATDVTSGTSSIYYDANRQQPVIVPPNDPNGVPLPPQDFTADTNTRGDLRRFTWGTQGGFGIVYPFGSGDLFLDARGGLGLTHIQKDTVTGGSSRTGVFLVALGYSFRRPER